MNIYTTRDLADAKQVSIRTIQRACAAAGIARRPLVIVGEQERKAVLSHVTGKIGNPEIAKHAKDAAKKRWGK